MAAIIPTRNEYLLQLSKGFSKYLDEQVEEGRRQHSYSLSSGTNSEPGVSDIGSDSNFEARPS
jgi:hypothetical protein